MRDDVLEYIVCAAIWCKDLESSYLRPVNCDRGTVVCGHRHPHCIATIKALTGLRTVTYAEDGIGDHEQGFLTSKNRYVNRKEALKIAILRKQVDPNKIHSSDLFSEDIY